MKKDDIMKLAVGQGLLPPFNHTNLKTAKQILDAIYAGGLRIIEFTNRSPNALDVFASLIKHAEKKLPDLVIGVGTIMNAKQAKQFHKAGAQFIVAPTLNLEVGAYCSKHDLFWPVTIQELQELYKIQLSMRTSPPLRVPLWKPCTGIA